MSAPCRFAVFATAGRLATAEPPPSPCDLEAAGRLDAERPAP